MAHVLFGDAPCWKLNDEHQDIRGWEVRDANGTALGRVGGMAIDTDRQVVDTIILEDGSRFRAEDVELSDGVVYVTTYGAPTGVPTRPYTATHGVRPVARSADDAAPGAASGAAGFAAVEDHFRDHFRSTYGDDGLDYGDYAPAYRYGFDAAYDDRYGGRDFRDVEGDLREGFYRRFGYPMSDNIVWSRVRGAIHHAFDRVRTTSR